MTVVIPAYNRAATLPRAVESVLAQSCRRLCDIVVVDDGSTDDTAGVAARYAGELTYIRQANRGAGAARNAGIRASANEFVAFLDSDDWWEAGKIERQLWALRRFPQAGFVVGRTIGVYADGRRRVPVLPELEFDVPVDFAPALFGRCFVHTPAMMVRRSLLARAGLFRTCLRRAQDFDLWVRLACRAPGVFLNEVVAHFAIGATESLSEDAESQVLCTVRALVMLRSELRRRPDCRRAWRASVVHYTNLLRDRAYREGRYADALRWGLVSLARRPWGGERWEWGRCVHSLRCALVGPQVRRALPPMRSAESATGEAGAMIRKLASGGRSHGETAQRACDAGKELCHV